MPHPKSDLAIQMPEWVEAIEDHGCLRTMVMEALWARGYAVRGGALRAPGTKAAVEAADVTIRQIEDGRVRGETACKKAAAALRKYTQAFEAATSSTTRRKARRV